MDFIKRRKSGAYKQEAVSSFLSNEASKLEQTTVQISNTSKSPKEIKKELKEREKQEKKVKNNMFRFGIIIKYFRNEKKKKNKKK